MEGQATLNRNGDLSAGNKPYLAFGLPALLVIAGLLLFGRLPCPLLEPEEARYAEIAREMLAEGQFLTPVLHDAPYLQKPPMLYWLIMGCYCLFGVHDWSARLVPCLAPFLMVSLTVIWAWRRIEGQA